MRARCAAFAVLLTLLGAACASDSEGAESPVSGDTAESLPTTTIASGTTASEASETTEPQAPQSVTASTTHEASSDDFPDILAAQATPESGGTWRFDVTVSSPYDTPDRYADAWRVVGLDGTEYGVRVLTHDHASEQPFTRSQTGIAIPPEVTEVLVEGRDLANGWGGGTLTVELAGAAS